MLPVSSASRLTLENPAIEIPLNEDDAPNAFVSVLIIKGSADSKRKDPEPQLRLGYCELTVDPAKSRLTIDLATTQSETRPGDIIEVSGNVTDYKGKPVSAAEITFYAVDEGTLAVMGYDNPDPLSTFHQPRLMSLKNGTSLTNFIPESLDAREFGNKGFIIGGGEADAFAASDGGGEEEEKSRSDFNPTAAWMPALVTGSDGTFSARFKAPDTLTRYRLIAVASHGSSRFGNGISEAVVNKPFMLEPSPPAFAHEGDRIRSRALLQNTTDNAGTWKVELKLDSTTTANKTLMTEIDVPAKGQATVEFEVIFANTGTAKWQWSAEPVALANRDLPPALKQNLSDSVESTFEVRYPMPLLREVQFVTFNDPARKFNLLEGFSEELIAGRGHLEVEFARSRLLEAGGAIDYLLRYPYGCAEQTTSSTIPWIAAKNLRHLAPGFQRQSVTQIDKAIQAGADRLLGMQTSDGGIGYWSGNSSSSNWASSYAGLGLILCKEAGADVPQSSLDRLAGYLSSNLRGLSGIKTGYDYENYARGLYVLARLGKAENAYHSKLLEKADQIPQSARAFLALAMHTAKQEGAEEAPRHGRRGREQQRLLDDLSQRRCHVPSRLVHHQAEFQRLRRQPFQTPCKTLPTRSLAHHLGQRLVAPRHGRLRPGSRDLTKGHRALGRNLRWHEEDRNSKRQAFPHPQTSSRGRIQASRFLKREDLRLHRHRGEAKDRSSPACFQKRSFDHPELRARPTRWLHREASGSENWRPRQSHPDGFPSG
jgi:uncharacterized protein YfaS (alpha-2-macroglobulin family)